MRRPIPSHTRLDLHGREASPSDLHVACDREVLMGAEVAFRADRLTAPQRGGWILCVSTDCAFTRLTGVTPRPLGYELDRDGVLGLFFAGDVTSVRLTVASQEESGLSEWGFWIDDGCLDTVRITAMA